MVLFLISSSVSIADVSSSAGEGKCGLFGFEAGVSE